MFASLMKTRRFAPLFWCQFFSAFNDNFLKNTLIILITYKLAMSNSEALVQLAGATFIFPYFILSAFGGQIADRYDKAILAKRLATPLSGRARPPVAGPTITSLAVCGKSLFSVRVARMSEATSGSPYPRTERDRRSRMSRRSGCSSGLRTIVLS